MGTAERGEAGGCRAETCSPMITCWLWSVRATSVRSAICMPVIHNRCITGIQMDERALGHLYARYASVVFAFVLARVSDRGVAEEVSADVWLGCWRSARAFRPV